ncbi:MAG: PDZ domain-containing protein [Candidatus Abyssobacteria bacterium SURF_17]|uniref:PDZ domain-containing protein n=1 Tax=Candidatus Abyssobacteria bacterium SURF_17 TaxID=2093361 RepID=A0A419F8N0_9BACT|nr:MAG: PDZ domain-containing protein [Candidatus Abyssubacteria bacterium SURF_17]
MNDNVEFRRNYRPPAARPMSLLALLLVGVVAVAGFVLLRASRLGSPEPRAEEKPLAVQLAGESISQSRQNAIVNAASKAGPAVVSIGVTATRIVRGVDPLYDEFFDYFFRDFVPPARYYKYRETIPKIGSGVIVSPDGYVVTNEHVVQDAEEITVATSDGRTQPGKLVGVHEASDVAIIKVEAENLPYARLGDSDNLAVGEWAIAIGNPFGSLIEDAQPSVTVGVVSARKRSFKPGSSGRVYNDMIQTDAAINPGNSGGPLINADGEVIGINTFIFTRSGGSMGVGFAIPINRVKTILDEVKKYGRVRDVWLGFTVITVDPESARALGLPAGGAVVRSVEIGSPAEKAGLKPGDVLERINNRIIRDSDDALAAFGSVLVGDTFSIDVLRGSKELHLELVPHEAP